MNSLPLTLRLLGLAAFGSMASMRVCDPMLGTLSHDFDVSTGEASRVIAAFAVAYGVLQLFYGPLGDRLGKIRVINLATAGCAVFSALTALAPSLDVLVLSRAAMGGAAAGIIPLSMAWIGDQVGYEQRQATLGRFMGATVTGMMAGQWFGGVASDYLGWRMAFGLLSALFAVAAFTLYRKTGAQRAAHAQAASQMTPVPWRRSFHATLALLRLPRVRWVVTVTAIEGALAFGTLAFVPSRLVSTLGFSPSTAGGVMMLYGVGGLLYSQFVTRWLRLLGERGLALLGGGLDRAVAVGLGLRAAGGCGRVGLFFGRPGVLHAAQHLADPGHANGAACTWQCGHAVCLPAVPGAEPGGVGGGAHRGPRRVGLSHGRSGSGRAGPGLGGLAAGGGADRGVGRLNEKSPTLQGKGGKRGVRSLSWLWRLGVARPVSASEAQLAARQLAGSVGIDGGLAHLGAGQGRLDLRLHLGLGVHGHRSLASGCDAFLAHFGAAALGNVDRCLLVFGQAFCKAGGAGEGGGGGQGGGEDQAVHGGLSG